MTQSTVILALIFATAAGGLAGYYLRALRDYLKQLKKFIDDASYPKQRTYADRYRLEDMWAGADQALDDLELMELRTRQENENKLREIQALRKRVEGVYTRIVDARQAAPGDFPDGPAFPGSRKDSPDA